MGDRMKPLGIDKLALEERLALLDEIWDSVEQEGSALPVPEWHKTILTERLARLNAAPDEGRPYQEVLAELWRRT